MHELRSRITKTRIIERRLIVQAGDNSAHSRMLKEALEPFHHKPEFGATDKDPASLLKEWQHDAHCALKLARGIHTPSIIDDLQKNLRSGDNAFKEFKRNLKSSTSDANQQEAFNSAVEAFTHVAQQSFEPQNEVRASWLDRKTIVSAGPEELSREIKELANAGVTTIYFECDNGGYANYDSKIMPRNPDLAKWGDWDPLREALNAAHANGMKVEAWTKNFLGCNQALDEKLRKSHPETSIPATGPILSEHSSTHNDPFGDWALRQSDGKIPMNNNDLFLDPANPEARRFVQEKMLELAKHYSDLDGLQYDYIRYPFGNGDLGLNANNWKTFQKEFAKYKDERMPASPTGMNQQLTADWNEWKARQIDSFVQDTSSKLLRLNPKLDISAAVYPCDLNEQLRQHWSNWLVNGTVKTLNPMTYVPHDPNSHDADFSPQMAAKFKSDINDVELASDGKGRILPGIEVARVNADGVAKEVEIVKQLGLPGETLFATSVLNAQRLEEFEINDSKSDYARFVQLMHACWSDDNSDRKKEKLQFLAEAEATRIALNQVAPISSGDEIKPVLKKTSELKERINKWLEQNPGEKTAWTNRFMNALERSIQKLSAAKTPSHFLAWDLK